MNYFAFDTETMDADEKLIFDFGFVIHDEKGKILHQDQFLIKEVFDNEEIMDKAFYKSNIPKYMELLKHGKTRKISFMEAIKILTDICESYNVETVIAYNLLFDLGAIYDTFNYALFGYRKPRDIDGKIIYKKRNPDQKSAFQFFKEFFIEKIILKEVKFLCVYGFAAETIMSEKDFIDMAIKNNWKTEKGNIQTGAESVYRFLTKNKDFIEAHTALDDTLIEVEIFNACMDINPEYKKEIVHTPYKIVMDKYRYFYGEPA